ncbi:hypothetical protein Fmac_008217 [Flemingia macrophylla]|uniref:Uncharacterized protein n=1 Tax=Flemingia macrophylla TaxID=520843 RepID=A0ABD1MXM4_9FABA
MLKEKRRHLSEKRKKVVSRGSTFTLFFSLFSAADVDEDQLLGTHDQKEKRNPMEYEGDLNGACEVRLRLELLVVSEEGEERGGVWHEGEVVAEVVGDEVVEEGGIGGGEEEGVGEGVRRTGRWIWWGCITWTKREPQEGRWRVQRNVSRAWRWQRSCSERKRLMWMGSWSVAVEWEWEWVEEESLKMSFSGGDYTVNQK